LATAAIGGVVGGIASGGISYGLVRKLGVLKKDAVIPATLIPPAGKRKPSLEEKVGVIAPPASEVKREEKKTLNVTSSPVPRHDTKHVHVEEVKSSLFGKKRAYSPPKVVSSPPKTISLTTVSSAEIFALKKQIPRRLVDRNGNPVVITKPVDLSKYRKQ